jgi:hypothetical protein
MSHDAVTQALKASPLDIDALCAALNALDGDEVRVTAVRSIGGGDQAKIWAAAAGRSTTLEDIVPSNHAPATEVIHAGKNSLPVFTNFEKRFCRVAGDDGVLYGYNEGATRSLIGPGCFVAHHFADRDEVGVDYYQVPPDDAALPEGWPRPVPNEKGLQMLVFAKMIDYLRKVSDHVTIGRAVKKGKETGNYFLLCRTGDL